MKWRVLFILSLAELLGMTLWFSATAVVPALSREWALTDSGRAWLTMSVQIGFVAGTFVSALLNLADLVNARRLFAVSAFLGALCNGAIGLFADALPAALVLRFCTGVCLAGVYPPGMKIMASWFRQGRGMAIGMLVGALTVGSASPHAISFVGAPGWRELMLVASASSVAGGLLCLLFVTDGPFEAKGARFDWRFAARSLKNRGVRLANLAYFGHQWELYAYWTWIPLFLLSSFRAAGVESSEPLASAAAFAAIAVGGVSCVAAGLLADRYGRTTIAIAAMAVSGTCCLAIGPFFGGPPALVVAICLVWGFAVIADSAQFSASITELSEPEYIGTALTLQTCLGFLLTLCTIRLLPVLVDWLTWRWAFSALALGPALGSLAMYRLRKLPEAARIGGERAL